MRERDVLDDVGHARIKAHHGDHAAVEALVDAVDLDRLGADAAHGRAGRGEPGEAERAVAEVARRERERCAIVRVVLERQVAEEVRRIQILDAHVGLCARQRRAARVALVYVVYLFVFVFGK